MLPDTGPDPAQQRPERPTKCARVRPQAGRGGASLHQSLTESLCETRDIDTRVTVFTMAFEGAEDWRYRNAAASPLPTGRYSAGHAERFLTLITDDNPNLFRIGDHERLRDGAEWDSTTRTYVGGAQTLASRTMREIDALAAARFARSSSAEVVSNRVTLLGGRVALGMRLLRGRAAHHAAAEMVARIAAQGGDTSRIITDGDLIYAASAPETDRAMIFHSAMTLLAQDHATPAAALGVWLRVAMPLS